MQFATCSIGKNKTRKCQNHPKTSCIYQQVKGKVRVGIKTPMDNKDSSITDTKSLIPRPRNDLSPCFAEQKRPVSESNQAEMLIDCVMNI